jgi:hypothetical protein
MYKKTVACTRNLLNNSRTVNDLNTIILPKKRKFLLLEETAIRYLFRRNSRAENKKSCYEVGHFTSR